MHPLRSGKHIQSPGGSFVYEILGPCCQLFDREQLPWPCCSLAWKGKQPSWNRVGKRFIADICTSRNPSYYVKAQDLHGNEWFQVLTVYQQRLMPFERSWWYSKVPKSKPYPVLLND